MAFTSVCVILALAVSPGGAAMVEQQQQATANPIRKVVTMLQAMEKKVTAEGEKETELFEKFMCYCKNGDEALAASIADADAKVGQLPKDIEAAENEVKQLKSDLKQAQTDRAAAKTAMAEATSLREKEAATFASLKAEADANIAAATKATVAVEKGMSGSFLQTAAAQVLRNLVMGSSNMEDYAREELTEFLSTGQGYAPASGQIVGILKQMTDTMNKDLAEATAAEESAIKAFNELMAAKEGEVNALTKQIEEKMVRLGNLQVEIVEMKEDLDDTSKSLMEDKKFLADLKKNCATKAEEHAANMKLRGEELLALADTIKILNDDDALELFKKTLPASASLLQLQETMGSRRQQALAVIRANRGPELNFIALALQGKKVDFSKVLKMIDEMVVTLKTEQQDDNDKKEYCEMQFDLADDKKKSLERTVSNLEKAIEKAKEGVKALAAEIEALQDGLKALDKSVAEATEQRKEENTEYTELMANDGAAKELLGFAKNRLNKFYNPKLYKAPPKRKLSEEEQITVNMGGTLAPTAAPGGIAGTGVTVLASVSEHKAAPPPPPETAAAFSKKSEESNGVIAMIDTMVADLTKEMTQAKTEEKNAQEDYESAMKDAAEKRAADSKSLADKEKEKAELAAEMEANTEEKSATTKTLMATLEHIQSLHAECDWLLQYFEVRKEARAGEIESLKTAKAVLSGADFSLMETGSKHRSLRGQL
jgi:predicted  nucleic acid-binding Zn-ribbon protein